MLHSDDGELISFLFTEGETRAPAHRPNSSHSAEFCIYHPSDPAHFPFSAICLCRTKAASIQIPV